MAEEVQNASVNVPWSMVVTTLLNGALGFGIVLAVLFVTVDIESVLQSPPAALGFPYIQIFYDSVGSTGGATGMTVILLLMSVCGTISALATASRLIWALARDRGLPFWSHVSKVRSGLPNMKYGALADCGALGANGQLNPRLFRFDRFNYSVCYWANQRWIINGLQRRHFARRYQLVRFLCHHRKLPAVSSLYWWDPLEEQP